MNVCRNVGTIDRAVRVVVGVVAITLAFAMLGLTSGEVAGIVAGLIGVVMLATAALRVCPLYVPLKLSTCGIAGK
jgi:hypothetical protein